MDNNIRDELIKDTAAYSHKLWCFNEYEDFYNRLTNIKDKNVINRFNKACIKNNIIRNEVIINTNDINYLNKCIKDYSLFRSLVDKNVIIIKRYVKRNITNKERKYVDYKDNFENILRDFNYLSSDSKCESIEGARSTVDIYIKLKEAGITINDMESNDDIKNIIGTYIHMEWLKRNMDYADDYLKVPYIDLKESEKEKDLKFFYIMLSIVKDNLDKYEVKSLNSKLPNYIEEELKILKK